MRSVHVPRPAWPRWAGLSWGRRRRAVAAVAVVAALALAGGTACDATGGAAIGAPFAGTAGNVAFTQGSGSSHLTKYCGARAARA